MWENSVAALSQKLLTGDKDQRRQKYKYWRVTSDGNFQSTDAIILGQ